MAQIQVFFNIDTTKNQLGELIRILQRISKDEIDNHMKAQQLASVIKIIVSNAKQFDEACQQNIKWIGNSLTSRLHNLDESKINSELDDFSSTFYRLVVELDLSMKDNLSFELSSFQRFVKENLNKFDASAQEQIQYARQEMPINILKALLNHDEIGNLKNVSEYSSQLDTKFDEWEKALVKHENTIKSFQESLNAQETAFNFVGLFDGFSDLATVKKQEILWLRICMIFFGALLVTPLLFELYYVYSNRAQLSGENGYFLGSMALISLSLTLLFIYFFRISVRSADSCKAQLLQIELRKTLCRFIQSYVTYSEKIKEKNPDSLAKFENLIFSGIVSSDEKLPSTFDGIEQIANFVKSMKQK